MNTIATTRINKSVLGVCLLNLAVAYAQAGHPSARTDREVVSTVVDTRDLDVSTRDGARAVHGRIASVAEEICWPRFTRPRRLPSPAEARHARLCFERAVDDAIAEASAKARADIAALAGLERRKETDGLVASQ